jgi:uncharacterized protein YbjT (DUF2867 family)
MILVVGATGRLGSRIVNGLVDRGTPVRMLVRQASAYQALADRGAEVAFGDLADPASLQAACRGIDTVITTANSTRRTGADNVDSVDLTGTASLIEAARGAGVRRFVYTSVLGVSESSPVPFLAAKAKSESALRASGMAWTILAPDYFQESWPLRVVGIPATAGQPITIVGQGYRKHTFVAEADVAAFALAALASDAAANRLLPIGGPEPLSWRDVIALYERLLDRPLEVLFVKPGEPAPGLQPAIQPLVAAFDTYDTTIDTSGLAREFGVTLTPLEVVARHALAAAGGKH